MAKPTEVLIARFYKHVAYATLATAILWTLITVYNTLSTDYPAEVKPEILAPLNPTINAEIMRALENRTDTQGLVESYVPMGTGSATTSSGL